jgi:hypothetical protein
MRLKDYDLRQIDEVTLQSLSEEDLRTLSAKLLLDLKEARERLNQSPKNSSRPPSSRDPWDKNGDSENGEEDGDGTETPEDEKVFRMLGSMMIEGPIRLGRKTTKNPRPQRIDRGANRASNREVLATGAPNE